MAELLIRVHDKINDVDFYLNCACTKRGDVIVAMPDGWIWGKEELIDPNYRIFHYPDLSLAEAEALTAPEVAPDPLNPPKTLQRRASKFNLDDPTLPKEFHDFIADDTRAAPIFKFVTKAEDAGAIIIDVVVDVPKDENGVPIKDENGKEIQIVEQKETTAVLVPLEDFRDAVIVKEPIKDPALIGDPVIDGVIG